MNQMFRELKEQLIMFNIDKNNYEALLDET